jgi:hypothetical protein
MRNMRQHLLMSALMLSGLMPMDSGPGSEPVLVHGHRSRPISPPYSPPKREPPPLTPEQIKAQEKRERRAAKRKELNDATK